MTISVQRPEVHEPAPARPRARWRYAVAAAAVLAVAATSTVLASRSSSTPAPPARVTVGGGVITVAGGVASLPDVAAALPPGQRSLLQTGSDGSVGLGGRLVVGAGGDLTISATTVRLLSSAGAGIVVQAGGSLTVDRSTIVSWTGQAPQTVTGGGRPSLVATGAGSRLVIDHSLVADLGTSQTDPGVDWTAGATGGASDSTFDGDYAGLAVLGGIEVQLTGDTESRALTDGLLLQRDSRTTVVGSSFTANALDGLAVTGSSDLLLQTVEASGNEGNGINLTGTAAATVDEPRLFGNKLAGLVASTSGLALTGPQTWSNSTGLSFNDTDATVDGGWSSDNTVDGAAVATGGTVDLDGIRLDHNTVAGLVVVGGRVAVTAGDFDQNATGLSVTALAPAVTVTGSTFTKSTKDAIALTVMTGLHLQGNTISGTADAAVSTVSKQDVSAILAANTIASGQTRSRVRVA